MGFRLVVACVALLACAACAGSDLAGPGGSSLAGDYRLTRVDDQPLPTVPRADSTGVMVTILEGSLTLGEAAPEDWVVTPAGWMAKSCVHQVPDGARVSQDGVVTLPDGTTYRIPQCGDGPYTLSLTQRVQEADGSSHDVTVKRTGRYVWGEGRITLLRTAAAAGLVGSVAGAAPVEITVGPSQMPPFGQQGPTYTFSAAR